MSGSATADVALLLVGFLLGLPTPHVLRAAGAWLSSSAAAGGAAGASLLGGGGGGGGAAGGGAGGASTSASASSSSGSARAAAAAAAPPRRAYRLDPVVHAFCNGTNPYTLPEAAEAAAEGLDPSEVAWPQWAIVDAALPHDYGEVACHWTKMWHPGVPMTPLNVCTHDPAEDGVISTFLHTYHFWGAPDDYNLLLAMGPCTRERPYMLDIGANLGVYTILGTSRGCKALSFEPLSQNILRLSKSLASMGLDGNALLFKHAVRSCKQRLPRRSGTPSAMLALARARKHGQRTTRAPPQPLTAPHPPPPRPPPRPAPGPRRSARPSDP